MATPLPCTQTRPKLPREARNARSPSSKTVTFLPRLTYQLLAAGQSEATIRKVLGENLLRVFGAVEQRAYALRGTAPRCNDPATDHLPRER